RCYWWRNWWSPRFQGEQGRTQMTTGPKAKRLFYHKYDHDDPLVTLDKELADAAAFTRAGQGIPLPQPAAVPQDAIVTASLPVGSVHLYTGFPPVAHSLCRWTLAVVEATAVPQLLGRLNLRMEDLFIPSTGGGSGLPCIILGDAVVTGSGADDQRPAAWYLPTNAVRLTKLFSEPRRQADLQAKAKAAQD